MSARRFGKKFVEKLAVKHGLKVVRGYILKRIKGVTPDDVYLAIKENKSIWDIASKKDKKKGRLWAKKFAKYKRYVTSKNVLEWLSYDRPELASVIIHMSMSKEKPGIKWWVKQVKEIKQRLWPAG